MTDRERKDYYLKRIEKILLSNLFKIQRHWIPRCGLRRLEEELKIIMWNNAEDWADAFIKEEVVPLLKKHRIKIRDAG